MNRTLIVGGTGTVGSQVLAQMVDAGANVRVLARKPDAVRWPSGVEVMQGDLTVPETLDASLDGIDQVFLVWMAPLAAVGPALERLTKRAKRIVYLSAPHKTLHPLFQASPSNPSTTLHVEIERMIEASGVEWTFLRPGMFAGNARGWWRPQIRTGDVVRWPYLSVPTAPIDERDIARIAVRALREDGHAGAEYLLTGRQSLSHADQIETIARALGRSLRIEEMPPEDAPQELLNFGFNPPAAKMLLEAWAAAAGHPAFMSPTFEEITGTRPGTFFEWATDYAAEFRS